MKALNKMSLKELQTTMKYLKVEIEKKEVQSKHPCNEITVLHGQIVRCRKPKHSNFYWHEGLRYARVAVEPITDIFFTVVYTWRQEIASNDDYINNSNASLNKYCAKCENLDCLSLEGDLCCFHHEQTDLIPLEMCKNCEERDQL